MSKQSIFSRVNQLVRANVNAMLDKAEDPERMLDQMVTDFTNNIREAEEATSVTIGNLRMLEHDYHEQAEKSQEWQHKALAASSKAEEFAQANDSANADKFNKLARIAIQRQMDAESSAQAMESTINNQKNAVEQLRNGLDQMKFKRNDLVHKRDELLARKRMAETQSRVHETLKQIDTVDPTSEISSYEEKIRSLEAGVRGQQELAASSLEAQFAELEDPHQTIEIEARLAALKQGQKTIDS